MPVTMSLFGMMNWVYMWFKDGGPISREDYADLATDLILQRPRHARRGRRAAGYFRQATRPFSPHRRCGARPNARKVAPQVQAGARRSSRRPVRDARDGASAQPVPASPSARASSRSCEGASALGSRRSSITAGRFEACARSKAAAKSSVRSTVSPCPP
jgi:hypothetical protein